MAEFIIRRNASDSKIESRFAYKRGDIINVLPDGDCHGKTHLTVLKVPNLKQSDVRYLEQEVIGAVTIRETFPKDSYEKIQKGGVSAINNITKLPTIIKTLDDKTYEADVERLDIKEVRQYTIPSKEMDEWFSGVKTVKELSLFEWNDFKKKLLNRG